MELNTLSSLRDEIPDVCVIDSFYARPEVLRAKAMSLGYQQRAPAAEHPGVDSLVGFFTKHHMHFFEQLLGPLALHPLSMTTLGRFRATFKGHVGPQHVHNDANWWVEKSGLHVRCASAEWSAVLYLNPDPPRGMGLQFWTHRPTGLLRHPSVYEAQQLGFTTTTDAYQKLIRGSTPVNMSDWQRGPCVEGIFNRLVVFKSDLYHSAEPWSGFGESTETARLVQLFFLSSQWFADRAVTTSERVARLGKTEEIQVLAQTLRGCAAGEGRIESLSAPHVPLPS